MMVAETGICWSISGLLQILWIEEGRGEENKVGSHLAFACGYQRIEDVNACVHCLPGCRSECLRLTMLTGPKDPLQNRAEAQLSHPSWLSVCQVWHSHPKPLLRFFCSSSHPSWELQSVLEPGCCSERSRGDRECNQVVTLLSLIE